MTNRTSLETTVSIFEAITTFWGLLAAITAVIAASLYFFHKRKKGVGRSLLESIAVWVGRAAVIFALLAAFASLGYFFKNNQLKVLQRQDQVAMEADIARANARAEEAIVKQHSLEVENLRQATVLERERLKRLELEDALYSQRYFDPNPAINTLRPYSGTSVLVEWKGTEEATGLATQIAYTLQEAKWDLLVSEIARLTSERPLQVGVIGILIRCSPGDSFFANTEIPNSCDESVAEAADALVRELEENDLRVWRDFRLPIRSSIKVMVGEKDDRLMEWQERRRQDKREKRKDALEQ